MAAPPAPLTEAQKQVAAARMRDVRAAFQQTFDSLAAIPAASRGSFMGRAMAAAGLLPDEHETDGATTANLMRDSMTFLDPNWLRQAEHDARANSKSPQWATWAKAWTAACVAAIKEYMT